jgi:acyl carrier protein
MKRAENKMPERLRKYKRLTYRQRRERTAQQVMKFSAGYFGLPVEQVNEETILEDIKRDPHDLIRFMLAVEERFGFDFPDNLTNKRGRLKQCRADTIKTIGELVTYIARLKR